MAISSNTLTHEILGDYWDHGISSIGIMVGLGASAIGIVYFAFQKHLENNDKKLEHDAFRQDLKTEMTFLSNLDLDKLLIKNDKILTHTDVRKISILEFYSFELFNNKYRHIYDSEIRSKIGNLKLLVSMYIMMRKNYKNQSIKYVEKFKQKITNLRD